MLIAAISMLIVHITYFLAAISMLICSYTLLSIAKRKC